MSRKSEPEMTAEDLLAAYANGFFPMAEDAGDDRLYWFFPEVRAILPLDDFHIPRSLAKLWRRKPFEIRFNTAFAQVIAACAEATPDRRKTWINRPIRTLYTELHRLGHAHSVECWRDGALVGGLYGVQVGAAFCGESMFSRASNASRIALVVLVERLRERGFTLLDCQYENEHLTQFGCIGIAGEDYRRLLRQALTRRPVFHP